MSIRFTILASGSTGNATLIKNEEATILVDAGLSAKKLEQLMESRQTGAKEIDAILVTHEHSDHIKGLGALARKHDLPIYANQKTWEVLDHQLGEIMEDQRKVLVTGEMLDFGTMKVESYGISHDAAEPIGYCFYDGEEKLSLATDLGYMSHRVKESIRDSDVLVLESNHDVGMLRVGRYPWNIKRRILSDVGHLSNDAAGDALCELSSGKLKRTYLAHLSREHNVMDLAKLTVNTRLEEADILAYNRGIRLMDTYHDRATPWDSIGED